MKKLLLSFATLAILASCSKDDDKKDVIDGTTINGGTLTESYTIDGDYTINNTLYVKEGITLTIKEGSKIKGSETTKNAFILIEKGAKILANGTSTKPITFKGCGGIIINGDAPIAGGEEASTTIDKNVKFGGKKSDDDSGLLDYVIIEDSDSPLTLNGVGSKTDLSNIMVRNCKGDGVTFCGGTANITNLLIVNAKDDMFSFTMGYTGSVTTAYGIREASFTERSEDPCGIEAEGNKDGKSPNQTGQSEITVKNITIENLATSDKDGKGRLDDAIKIMRGAKATITNALVKTNVAEQSNANIGDVIDLVDKLGAAVKETQISCSTEGNITWKVCTETDNEAKNGKVNFTGTAPTKETKNTGADKTKFSWTKYTFK